MIRIAHIPKTGGNSLRLSLADVFGNDRIVADYPMILAESGTPELWEAEGKVAWFSHKPFEASAAVPAERTVVFVREPISRVLSHFQHAERNKATTTFEKFVKLGINANLQTQYTRGLDLDEAFVGVFEHYEESLRRLGQRFGIPFTAPHYVNVNPQKPLLSPIDALKARYQPSEEQVELIRKYHAEDFELYEAQLKKFRQADQLASLPWYYRPYTFDRDIFRHVLMGEYGPIDFRGKAVLDVGGHIGGFAVLAASSGARITHVYEPEEQNFTLLKSNALGLPIHPHQAAVWGSQVPELHYVASTDPKNTGGGNVVPDMQGQAVQGVSFDDVIASTGPFDILKLDCESSEYPIVFTSKRLREIETIVGEYHPNPRYDTAAFFQCIRQNGFEVEVKPTVDGFGKFTATRQGVKP